MLSEGEVLDNHRGFESDKVDPSQNYAMAGLYLAHIIAKNVLCHHDSMLCAQYIQ